MKPVMSFPGEDELAIMNGVPNVLPAMTNVSPIPLPIPEDCCSPAR